MKPHLVRWAGRWWCGTMGPDGRGVLEQYSGTGFAPMAAYLAWLQRMYYYGPY